MNYNLNFTKKEVIKLEEDEKDIYTTDGIFDFIENDEISSIEEGFMNGYLASV